MLHSTCFQVAVVTFFLLTFLVTTGLTLQCYECEFVPDNPKRNHHPCFSATDSDKETCEGDGDHLCYTAAILGKEKKLLFSAQDCVARSHDEYGKCISNMYGKTGTCLKLPVHEYLQKLQECNKLKTAPEAPPSGEAGEIKDTPDTFVYFCHCTDDLCNGADPTDSVEGTDTKSSHSTKSWRRENTAFILIFVSTILLL